MTKDQYIEATGEEPEDMFGSDWENIIAEMDSTDNFDEARYDALQDTYSRSIQN